VRKGNRGFTVIELIVSVALIAIIFVPVAGFFTNSFRIQGRSSMKTAITRTGQYIIENFKNKNYLTSGSTGVLTNSEGKTFEDFIKTISLTRANKNSTYEIQGIDNEDFKNWHINYKDFDYNVTIEIDGFTTSDILNSDVPDKSECEGIVEINSDGSLSRSINDKIVVALKGSSFTNPIDNKVYEDAEYPTIILKEGYTTKNTATLWIKNNNYYDNENGKQKIVRIIKEFNENLNVYIEGTNFTIKIGQDEDGASYSQKKMTSLFVGKDGSDKKSSESEILLDAKMIIKNVSDDSVSDSFEFSFPINYDYSK